MAASILQKTNQVLVRNPARGHYDPPAEAAPWAAMHWPYAAMAENIYRISKAAKEGRDIEAVGATAPMAPQATAGQQLPSAEAVAAACKDRGLLLPIPGWTRWRDFPDATLTATMRKSGLFLVVYEHVGPPRTIAIVFEGTNLRELRDWKANFRWFLRFLPMYRDQYTIIVSEVAEAFHRHITDSKGRYRVDQTTGRLLGDADMPIGLVATGDSLGGGLAQQFAYAFKRVPDQPNGPKIDEVYAFDPSPVTGWFSTPDPPRSDNAKGLVIHRIFEHGEILAYLRLLTSRLAVTARNPAIWEYRYNFAQLSTPVRSHSIHRLACGLLAAALPTPGV